jgi:UPF0716 protein FxsA
MPLFLALLIVPLIEIGLFIEVGGWIGLWPTLATVVLTALIGSVLLRSQGAGALRQVQASMQAGGDGDPVTPLAHGALILVAGIVLLTPGFFTDAIGFALLVPAVRGAVIRYLAKRMRASASVQFNNQTFGTPHGYARPDPAEDVVDGEYEVAPESEPPRDPSRASGWVRKD